MFECPVLLMNMHLFCTSHLLTCQVCCINQPHHMLTTQRLLQQQQDMMQDGGQDTAQHDTA